MLCELLCLCLVCVGLLWYDVFGCGFVLVWVWFVCGCGIVCVVLV